MRRLQRRHGLGLAVGMAGLAALAFAPGGAAQGDPNAPTTSAFPISGYADITWANGRREMVDLTSGDKQSGILFYPPGAAHRRGDLVSLSAYGTSKATGYNLLALIGRTIPNGIPDGFLPPTARPGFPTGLQQSQAVYRNPLVRRGIFQGSAGAYWDAYFELALRRLAQTPPGEGVTRGENQVASFVSVRNEGVVRFDAGPLDASPPNAPEATPRNALRNNHYRCYAVTNHRGFRAARVASSDQFERNRQLRLLRPVEVCNPVNKLHNRRTTPTLDSRVHLVGYGVAAGPRTERTVGVHNQFQNVRLDTERRTVFYAPSTKRVLRGRQNRIPRRTSGVRPDHFACYSAKPRAEYRRRVVFFDQFERTTSQVLSANGLCNPVKKAHRNRTFPIRNANGHLVSYRVSQNSPRRVVQVRNQFGSNQQLVTGKVTRVLVPSHKRLCAEFRSLELKLPLAKGGQTLGTLNRLAFVPYGGNDRGACPGPN